MPMDSWEEDRLSEASLYRLLLDGQCIGYCGIVEGALYFFHVLKAYFRHAASLLEKIIADKAVDHVFVMTQDALFSALIAEWDYEKRKVACFFTDCGVEQSPIARNGSTIFRVAELQDIQRIVDVTGDFFDEASSGFNSLKERIEGKTIFVLEDNEQLLGCGIIERGRFCEGTTSIGMYVNRAFRRQGAAKTILLNLKEWAYANGLKPVAGCWYYNTLSRKSLESAGMIASSIGYEAILKGKEKLPLRTGNPPGELVEE